MAPGGDLDSGPGWEPIVDLVFRLSIFEHLDRVRADVKSPLVCADEEWEGEEEAGVHMVNYVGIYWKFPRQSWVRRPSPTPIFS